MRKVKLYIASSLDGKIAKPDGDIKWLEDTPNPEKSDFGYSDFVNGVDTVLMGNKTYQEILGGDLPFPYIGKQCYVFTRNTGLDNDKHVQFISSGIEEFVTELKSKEGADIWLVGGGQINQAFLEAGLVDEIRIFIMPILLGEGIPLVNKALPEKYLQLKHVKTYPGGAVELVYGIPGLFR